MKALLIDEADAFEARMKERADLPQQSYMLIGGWGWRLYAVPDCRECLVVLEGSGMAFPESQVFEYLNTVDAFEILAEIAQDDYNTFEIRAREGK